MFYFHIITEQNLRAISFYGSILSTIDSNYNRSELTLFNLKCTEKK